MARIKACSNTSSAGANKISRANVFGYYSSKIVIVKFATNLAFELLLCT